MRTTKISATIICSVMLLFVVGTDAQAAIPLLINHQGVVQVSGTAFDGMGLFKFGFLDANGLWLWTNDGAHLGESAAFTAPDAAVELTVRNGVYAVILGDTSRTNMTALPSAVFDDPDIKLRVFFDDGTVEHGEQLLEPDQPVTATAYAYRALDADHADAAGDADTVDGMHAADLDPAEAIGAGIATHAGDPVAHHTKTIDASELSQGTLADARLSANVSLLGPSIDLTSEVAGVLPDANIAPAIARDAEIGAHDADAAAHTALTLDASQIITGTLDNGRLDASAFVLPAGAMVLGATAYDSDLIAAGYTFTGVVLAGASADADTWSARAGMPTGRYGLAAAAVNGVIYAIGGNDIEGSSPLTTIEAYDPASNTWSGMAPMPTARSHLAAAAVNGVIYAIGGRNGSYLTTIEAYEPASNTWSAKAPMPTARDALAAAAVNGVIYAIGGHNGSVLRTIEAYDPVTDTWSTKAPMPTARSSPAAAVVNGVIYVIGGHDASSVVTANEEYHPTIDTWGAKFPMPTARNTLAAAAVNGVIYAIGGYYVSSCSTNEAYTPSASLYMYTKD